MLKTIALIGFGAAIAFAPWSEGAQDELWRAGR
jgi:hypothetical protein